MLVPFSNNSLCEHSGTVQPQGGTRTALLFRFYTESVHLANCGQPSFRMWDFKYIFMSVLQKSGWVVTLYSIQVVTLHSIQVVTLHSIQVVTLYTIQVVTLHSIQVVTLYTIQVSNKIYEQSFSCKA